VAELILHWLPAGALAVMLAGMAWRTARLLRAPVRLPVGLLLVPAGWWALTPRLPALAITRPGFWLASPLAWLTSSLLHLSLLALVLGHLELFWAPAPAALAWLGGLRAAAGWCLALALALSVARRLMNPALTKLARPSGLGLWGLMLAVVLSGLWLGKSGLFDPVSLKQAALSVVWAWPAAWPGAGFAVHLLLALSLAVVFPFSRLMHGLWLMLNPVFRRMPAAQDRPRLGPLEPLFSGDAPRREAVLPGEPPLATVEDYRARLERRWAALGVRRVLSAGQRAAGRGDGS